MITFFITVHRPSITTFKNLIMKKNYMKIMMVLYDGWQWGSLMTPVFLTHKAMATSLKVNFQSYRAAKSS